jgi:hypothetical protein
MLVPHIASNVVTGMLLPRKDPWCALLANLAHIHLLMHPASALHAVLDSSHQCMDQASAIRVRLIPSAAMVALFAQLAQQGNMPLKQALQNAVHADQDHTPLKQP